VLVEEVARGSQYPSTGVLVPLPCHGTSLGVGETAGLVSAFLDM
jgi:hypothetical protein